MILYSSSAIEFHHDVETNRITDRIREAFLERLGYLPGIAEQRSWANSLQYMERIIRNAAIPDDCGILIEFAIPATNKRIDFMVTGLDAGNQDHFVIVELKQWETADATDQPDIVKTYVGQAVHPVTHPSYQAWSYRQFLTDMNEAIEAGCFQGHACAYLHNYARKPNEPLLSPQYSEIVKESPLFFKDDYQTLQQYIHQYVCRGKGINTIHYIENGRIRPSKKLMDYVGRLLEGHSEFILLDEQKVAFESIMAVALKAREKTVVIVEGGPGTGKSVLSVQVMGQLLQKGKHVQFVAPNAAFRVVLKETLAKNSMQSRVRLNSLFSGSSGFVETPDNAFDVLVIDEAHRLKNGKAYQYRGENQVEDIIRSAQVSILFVDDSQQIRPEDIGSVKEILSVAKKYKAKVHLFKLETQFRCAGAEGFINWISDVLQIEKTGNAMGWDQEAFEFRLYDTPQEVYKAISEKAAAGYKARLLAGYAWPWTSARNGNPSGEMADVKMEEYQFAMPWNPRTSREKWAISENGLQTIGCIHTAQGLEFDYVGVLIGYDLKFDPVTQRVYADPDEYKDIAGKKGLSGQPEELTRLVKNIYKVLCSRGMKGCYLFCRDRQLSEYIKRRFAAARRSKDLYDFVDQTFTDQQLRVADHEREKPEEVEKLL